LKSEFSDYLKQFKISQTITDRIHEIYNTYVDILGLELDDIFITDYVTSANDRKLENLWFFNSKYMFEAKDFTTGFNIDAMRLDVIIHWEIKKRDYDFKTATEKSRLTISTKEFEASIGSTMRASGENCNQLFYIFQKYFKLNLASI